MSSSQPGLSSFESITLGIPTAKRHQGFRRIACDSLSPSKLVVSQLYLAHRDDDVIDRPAWAPSYYGEFYGKGSSEAPSNSTIETGGKENSQPMSDGFSCDRPGCFGM